MGQKRPELATKHTSPITYAIGGEELNLCSCQSQGSTPVHPTHGGNIRKANMDVLKAVWSWSGVRKTALPETTAFEGDSVILWLSSGPWAQVPGTVLIIVTQ